VPALLCAAALVRARVRERTLTARTRAALLAPLVILAAAAFAFQVGNSTLARSSRALDEGDAAAAMRHARRAHTWAPWSAQPWQRLGEAQLAAGEGAAAARSFQEALERDPGNWELWLELSLAADGGEASAARERARILNPRGVEAESP
jgi:Tfp pilus assembly protein PilF